MTSLFRARSNIMLMLFWKIVLKLLSTMFLTPGRVNGINFRALTRLQRSYNKSKFRQEAFQDKATTTTVVINAH
jgi:hypothetical protein